VSPIEEPEQSNPAPPPTPVSNIPSAEDGPPTEFPTFAASRTNCQSEPPVYPPWSWWDMVAVVGFTVATIVLFSAIALGIAHLFTASRKVPFGELATSTAVLIGGQVAAYPLVILFMALVVRNKTDEGFWRAIRWNWPPSAAGFLIAGMAFAFAIEYASRWLPIPKSLPVDQYFSEITGAYLMAAFGVTLAPLFEELVFRGMFYPLARKSAGVAPAILLTGTFFAAIHGTQLGYAWAPLVSIFVVGVVFTLVRERTGSVAASFAMHCGYNLTLFGLLWVSSDHFRHLERLME